MTFDKIIQLMNNLEAVDTLDKFESFEKSVNDYILEIIYNKNNIEQLNKDYKQLNDQLLNLNPLSIKEIIQSNYDPSIYPKDIYPDIQYYTFSIIQDFNTFAQKFNSSDENKKKYALINILINKEDVLTKNAINMKYLKSINKLSNLLLNIYSYKINREDGKLKKLKNELSYIIDNYNEINHTHIKNEKKFIKEYINPFIESWNQLKDKFIQYKCRVLRDINKGEKPFEFNFENELCYFLVDDGDKEGGMFLASAYEHFIEWQNSFIDEIISKNNMNGILNSYISQLEKEINIQDATQYEIINIDDKTYKKLNELISSCSMRNIFNNKENKIDYKNYNDIIYNYDLIEEELGKLILPGLIKFKKDKIKFITYLYEGFRGENSTLLIDYNNKYTQRELTEDEKNSINKILKSNNNNKFNKEIFASLQILMNEIIKENYEQNYLIYNIIECLPKYIILNEELIKLIKNKYKNSEDNQSFTINSLVSIFEYFEDLCWNEIKTGIPKDYQIELDEDIKKYILNYFDIIKNEKKLITKKNLTSALRKLISRFIAGSRLDIDIKADAELKLYITRIDLWNKNIVENKLFEEEIDKIYKYKILICHSWSLYNLLEGDYNNYEEMHQRKKNKNLNNEKKEYQIDTSLNQNIINEINDKIEDEHDDEVEEMNKEEENDFREDYIF